ncbi:MAG: hypothetical protein IPH32_15455 [Bacteroidetes bacterium]|nr:hypothetical protein [Bacteroidota bacterium]
MSFLVCLGNDTSLTCAQSLTLNAGFPGASYLWSTGATSSSITVSAPGPYWVTVSSCGATDSDTIQVNALIIPIVVDLGNDTSLTCAQSLTLNAGFPGASYLWSTVAKFFDNGFSPSLLGSCSAALFDTIGEL